MSEGGRKGKQEKEGAVTHLPGSVCNQAAQAGSSIRALLSAAPACTSKACVISNHTWMQALLWYKYVHTHTVRSVRSNPHKLWLQLQQSHMRMHTQRGADTAQTLIHSVALLSFCAMWSSSLAAAKGSELLKRWYLWIFWLSLAVCYLLMFNVHEVTYK